MNLVDQIKGLHKIRMSVDEIAKLLSNAIVDSYVRHYASEGAITSYFELIGIYNTQKWKDIVRDKLGSAVRTQLHEKLKLTQCIEDVINNSSVTSKEFKKLERIINSVKFAGNKMMDAAFCKTLLQRDLNEIEYTSYELSDCISLKEPTKQDMHKIIRYVINACFFVTRYNLYRGFWLYSFNNLSVDIDIIKEELKYAEMMLRKCDNLIDVNIVELSNCVCDIIERLPAECQIDVLDETLALSRFIPTNLQPLFLDRVFNCIKGNSHIPLAKFIDLIAMCLNEGIWTAKDLYNFLTTALTIKANDRVLLEEIVALDKESFDQFQEIGALLKTFNTI